MPPHGGREGRSPTRRCRDQVPNGRRGWSATAIPSPGRYSPAASAPRLLQRERTGVATVVDGSLLGTAIWYNHQPIVASGLGFSWGGAPIPR